jgi:hypothetical protein
MENDNDKRTSRASQTREKQSKPKVWSPPSSLDAPPAPTGFVHRWIRTEILGFQDTKNVAGRIRSGYELVRSDEYPDSDYPQVEDGKYAGVIGVGALCWQGYRKRSQNNDLSIIKNKLRIMLRQ